MKVIPMFWRIAMGGLLLLMGRDAFANAIAVTNVGLTWKDESARTANVVFDLSWSNSWRGGENRDAAWVFAKFRAPGSNNWQHATLSTNSSDHRPSADSTIEAVSDGKGVFIYRNADYTGNVSYVRTKLQWNYGSNGYTFARGSTIEVSVVAIEMVYIPAGPFYIGSGGSEYGAFYEYPTTSKPYLITNETDAISIGQVNGYLYYPSPSGYCGDQTGVISNAFPKGYAAFYCMKYEISLGQYVDFLNLDQSGYWNTLMGITKDTLVTPPVYAAAAPNRACNYLYYGPGPYADWAALRPMTELEFEKACRGPLYPVSNEYAWGSTVGTQMTSFAGTEGSGTETPVPTTANYRYLSGHENDPHRVGLYAKANSTRENAGAGYFGCMELSGNCFERCVWVGPVGRAFRGTLGDGDSSTTNPDWPTVVYSESSWRWIMRGGARWDGNGETSHRGHEHFDRMGATGGRAVRQAP